MKLSKNNSSFKNTLFFGILTIFLVIFGWVLNLKPKSISDITVQLSLFAMEKGYQGVIRMDSGEISYSSFDYFKKIILSPRNLSEVTLSPLPKINLELPFEEESILQRAINTSLSYQASNERAKLNLNGELRLGSNKTVEVNVNLKGNGIDHLLYKNKESIRIEVKKNDYKGFSEFSLQHPLVRDFQLEPIYMAIAEEYGIISTHLELVTLNINGENKGIFLLEEVGTKEHLERKGKTNSVVVRFSAPRHPELIGSTISSSGRSETYRTATIDSLNTAKIQSNLQLYEYEKIAKGMLRSYLDGNVSASEIFDTNLMGKYIGISEVLGGLHPLIFHNFLFYYNPDTQLLEPIAYDASLHQRFSHSNLITNITEGFVEELLYDKEIFKSYSDTVYDLSYKIINDDEFIYKLKNIENTWYSYLVKEFWLLGKVDFDDIKKRAQSFQEKNLDSLNKKSSRKQNQDKIGTNSCNDSANLQLTDGTPNSYIENEYNLINSEYYKFEDCILIKVWTTAFDYPKDGNFPSNTHCSNNSDLKECNYKNITIKGIEVNGIETSKYVPLNIAINIEYSAMYNFGFPKTPKYLVFKIPYQNIKSIKIFYVDLLSSDIVYVLSDEIIYFHQ